MKRYIKANDYDIDSFDNIDDEYADRPEGYTYWNILWVTFDGKESGAGVWVPDGEDEWWYADQILKRDYPEEYDGGEIIDVIDEFAGDAEFRDEWLENHPNLIDVREYIARHGADNFIHASDSLDDSEAVIEPEPDDYIQSSMSEEEQLNWAIENGKPFDIETFEKYKVDPYRASGAVTADELRVGDIVQITEDASECDLGTEVEIIRIDSSDPDKYSFRGETVLTFECETTDTRDTLVLHFWPEDYVGPVVGHTDMFDRSELIESASEITRYSDVRPYEDRKYWYFTTHGIGPGTIPKDLNVLETKEGQNDKGTWGTYICLDGVLNTDELDYYDLRELAPDNINSADDIEVEDVDDESWWDEWDPYQGHKYRVYGNDYQANQAFDDPEKAIQCWFKYQKDAPMDVSIMSKTKADAIELVKAATPQLLTRLHARYKCPYKLDWLISEAEKQVENGCRSFYEDKYGYGDSVHPFGVG